MISQVEKSSGIFLLIGSMLMLATMLVHPAGGNVQYLIKASPIIITSHSMALLAVPFLITGFLGLTRKMGSGNILPFMGFVIILIAFIAGSMAATINGLVLPLYIQKYVAATSDVIASVKPIIRYNNALNLAFDYIFLVSVSIAILLYSISIVTQQILPKWLGYTGAMLSLASILMMITGFVFVNLHGFRIFIIGCFLWFLLTAMVLIRLNYYVLKK